MKILAIDTTTFLGSIALVEDALLVAATQMGTKVTYSERLIASIDHLLEGAEWNLSEVDLIATAVGPGSFTGLRIGIATAKGLALAASKPLVGASSLEVIAYGGQSYDGPVVAVIDARRDEVYAAAYLFDRGEMSERIMDETVMSPDALCDVLVKMNGTPLLIGDGVRRYGHLFAERAGDRMVTMHDSLNFPHAAYLAHIARDRHLREGADDLVNLAPNYIRLSDAEIGFRGRG